MQKNRFVFVLVMVTIVGCSAYKALEFNQKYGPAQVGVDRLVRANPAGDASFYDDGQPILERRCSVCHSCYDAPCQLKTTCFEGLDRGGTKALVYNSARLTADPPTRLHIDADSAEGWRALGFHPVLNERNQTPVAYMENSLLNLMLQLEKDNPLPQTDLLPETFDIRLDHDYICTTAEDFEDFKKKYPLWGMPYALPGLTHSDRETIVDWLSRGHASRHPKKQPQLLGRVRLALSQISPRPTDRSRFVRYVSFSPNRGKIGCPFFMVSPHDDPIDQFPPHSANSR